MAKESLGSGRLWPHHMLELFADCDEDVRHIIGEVLWIEQEHISLKNPRGVKEKIREFIDVVARQETASAEVRKEEVP